MDPSVIDMLSPRGVPSFKFAAIGDQIRGTIAASETRQQIDLDGKPLEWDDGQPKMQLVITLDTDLRDAEIDNDTGQRRIFAKKPGAMLNALIAAHKEVPLEVGTELAVSYVGDGEPTKKGYSAPKLYEAKAKPAKPVVDLDF